MFSRPAGGNSMSKSEAAHVLVIDSPSGYNRRAVGVLQKFGFAAALASQVNSIQTLIQETPPSCLVVPLELPGAEPGVSLAQDLKNDTIYGHLPVLATMSATALNKVDWVKLRVDEFILAPYDDDELLARVQICLARAQRDLNANPLTGLPGNIAIIREAEARLKRAEPFAVAYLDLDNFKPFNDKYGFLRGDEVLRMTARVVVNAARTIKSDHSFVGHVGGDDFVLITPSDKIAKACDEITRNFDLLITNFYDEEDRIRGAIHSIDRQGNTSAFSIMTCSIAVIDTAMHPVRHVADISARAAQVKKYAKSVTGSATCYDRRT